jgi:hypothetical protein
MKNTRVVLKMMVVGTILLSASGCDNEKDVKPDPIIDAEAMFENFSGNVDELTQEFTVSAVDGGTVVGDQGTKITFYANSFLNPDNTPVTGNVSIELVEIFKKSDMLLTRKPTNGKKPDGTVATLISGGEFFVNATQDGKQLKLEGGFFLAAPADNTGGADDGMFIFNGVETCEGNDCRLEWVQGQGRVEVGQKGGATGGTQSEYMAFQSQFGWTNIDKWYSDPRPKTTIFVDVPQGYDNTNCAVYVSYDNEPAALASFDVFNDATGLFTEHYGLIPIGLQVHFIFVSVVDGQWNYAIQPATITANHVQVISNVQPITEAQLETLIDDLP